MKIVVNAAKPTRKIVAVLGCERNGIFLPKSGGGAAYLSSAGIISVASFESLGDLCKHPGRTPVYDGDEITLEF